MQNSRLPIDSHPLVVPARTSVGLTDADLERTLRAPDFFWDVMARAMSAGDQVAIRRIASHYLLRDTHLPVSFSRERLILTAAAAQADHVQLATMEDLRRFLNVTREELDLVRLNDSGFGLRRGGSLDAAFVRATERLEELELATTSLLIGNVYRSATVIAGFSFLGDFPLTSAIAEALVHTRTNTQSRAVVSGRLRQLHQRPDEAVKYLEPFVKSTREGWILNSYTAALVDLGRAAQALLYGTISLRDLPQGTNYFDTRQRLYTARTLYRALRTAGLDDLAQRASAIATLNELPGVYSSINPAKVHQSNIEGVTILLSLGMPVRAHILRSHVERALPKDIARLIDTWESIEPCFNPLAVQREHERVMQ